jgi:hypothetical protein
LQRDVEFGEIVVAVATFVNVMNARHIVDLAGDDCIEFSKVADPTDAAILCWNNECR